MLVLGPNTIKRGLAPATAMIGCRGMALLGPAEGEVGYLDPFVRMFLVIGKILAIRRVVDPEPLNPAPSQIEGIKKTSMGLIDQVVDGFSSDWEPWEIVFDPLGREFGKEILYLETLMQQADIQVRRVVMQESVRVLELDPNTREEARVQAVIDYMAHNGLTVQESEHGMRDYLMQLFRDQANIPAAFPASTMPAFPDSWVTPEVIVPESTTRSWLIIL